MPDVQFLAIAVQILLGFYFYAKAVNVKAKMNLSLWGDVLHTELILPFMVREYGSSFYITKDLTSLRSNNMRDIFTRK